MAIEDLFSEMPVLETERLRLVKPAPQHAWDLFQFTSDPEATRFMIWPTNTDLVQTEHAIHYMMGLLDQGEVAPWLIQMKEMPQVIGMTGYNWWNPRHNRAEISYALARPYWGRGLAVEAVRAVVRFGFCSMDLNRIEALVHPQNLASRRVLERLAMTNEGTLREAVSVRGVPTDHLIYSLLRREWEDTERVG